MQAAARRTGISLTELAAEARGLSVKALVERFGAAFFLRQGGGGVSPATVLQTLTAQSASETAGGAGRGLLDYHVYPVRRAGASRFGGDYIGIGRGEHNDIAIEDASVSKFHAIVVQDTAGFSLADAGSRNGTSLNDERVGNYRDGKPTLLCDGDRLRLGDVRLTFMLGESLWRLLQRAGR